MSIETFTSDILTEDFLLKYKDKNPNWGFNGLGYIVFKRTYAREKNDGNTEEWWETIARCINGAQKIGAKYSKKEAEELYGLMFDLKCTYPGRMLWQLGTSTVDRFGANSLTNCWFCAMNEPKAFEFLFENLMLGGGVGFSVRREHVHELPKIKKGVNITNKNTKDADLIVPDSREGWVRLLHYVLKSYFETGNSFSYSTILVRGAGEKINGFGGSASGPQILVNGIEKICVVLENRVGKKLRSIDVLDICNIIGSVVVAGNVRRSAQIALGDSDDYLFLRAKRWDLGNVPNWRAMSNNTIYADSVDYISDEVWNGYTGNGEPYGFFNLPLAQKEGRIGEKINDECVGLNPCLTGGTNVYVADGRGNVTIKELATEGKDVPVFCYDKNNKVTVRYMRNPRKTGNNLPIYKVTLENGYEIKTTGNHKFLTKENGYVEVRGLKVGDSLKILNKIENKLKKNAQVKYFHLNDGKETTYEHRYIASFFNNKTLGKDDVVHHKDYNGTNNCPQNLEILTNLEHVRLHSKDMIGEKNPMRRAKTEWSEEKWKTYRKNMSNVVSGKENGRYSGYTHEDLKEHSLILTKQLSRRFSNDDWLKYAEEKNLPLHFCKWRTDHLGSILGLAKWAALELGIEHIDEDPRLIKTLKSLTSEGYDAFITNNDVFINKKCEVSGTPFVVHHSRREQSALSLTQANIRSWKNEEVRNKRTKGINQTIEKKKSKIREEQLKIFCGLKFKLNREPFKKEWVEECKQNKISFEISRKSSPFTSYKEIKEKSQFYNHKIVSVELVGQEDVYNGTVDEFHNFFVGGWEGKTKSKKRKWLYINNLNCGEITLHSYEPCNLSELCLNNIESKEELIKCAKLLYKTQKAVAAFNYLHEETNKIVHKNMRIGLSVTGICQALHKVSWLSDCYEELREFDIKWSEKNALNKSIKLTTVKPSGTVSILAGATPGIHPAFSEYYIRRVRMSSSDKLVNFCKEKGFNVEYVKNFDGTENRDSVVVEFPCKSSENAILSKDMSAVKQLELVKKIQKEWADNAISCTVYYQKEELPEIKQWLTDNFEKNIKSISFLLHSNHGFEQAPYSEITKEEYFKMKKKIKSISTQEKNFGNDILENMECAGGACPIR